MREVSPAAGVEASRTNLYMSKAKLLLLPLGQNLPTPPALGCLLPRIADELLKRENGPHFSV
jgi:hypothetical protein